MSGTEELGGWRINVRKHRQRVGLSQVGLARRLNISQKTISAWEVNGTNPSSAYVPDLAEAFGVEIKDLFERSGK